MCLCKLWLLSGLLALFSVFSVTCFNVDSFNYATYNGPDSTSMFGFSVAIHKETNNAWLIVGAPEAQSSYQQRVYRGGAVYKCPTDRDESCQEIPFDTKGDNFDPQGNQMDNKTEQWFGATVSASGSDGGSVVACAPRYTWYPKKKTRRDPVGTCYVSNGGFNQFEEYSPCRTFLWGYHRQGSCQAGFSAAINSDGDRLFIGAPGSWYWQGQMYSVDAHAKFEFKPVLFAGTYGSPGQVHQQSLETRPAVFSTLEGTEKDDDSYMGYSTIVGDFEGNGEQGIAVGMPRGNNLGGKVLLFTWNLTNFKHHFTSDQIGSYYGYAIAASDVDGDGKVDLIIGAPMYTVPNNEGKYDVGRVYVVYHESDKGKYVATYTVDGFKSKSRFGQALASLGDINQDGYGDFAVGAPYDGPNERGAVYIYHGSSKGVRKKYSQVIFAEDVVGGSFASLYTFGFSITGGLDLDGNEYPDMAVGAYLSNTAYFFRSRPVVIVEAVVRFLTAKKEVDIKNPNYVLRNGARAVQTQIDFCVKYHGKGIPYTIDLNLQYVLDSKKTANPRMGFVEFEGQNVLNDSIRIYKDTNETCRRKEVYVLSDIRDKLTSLVAEVKYWMQEEASFAVQRNPRSVLTPVLDLNSPPSRKDSISVHKDCGDDNICIPNLGLTITPSVDKYLLGSKENMFLDVFVANTGEDSFETTLEVKYPKNVYYVNTKDEKVESHVLCNTYENDTLKCEIGNPIPKDKIVNFKIFWQPTYKVGMSPTYDFSLLVNSTNQEDASTRGDNQRNISVGIWSNSRLEIEGKSHPGEVFFNSSLYTADISQQTINVAPADKLIENEIGPQVIHVYYLRNDGPATIEETEIFFAWPASLSGDDFLYLLEPPHFSPAENIQCGAIPANYRGFDIQISKKSIWERLNLNVEGESKSSGLSGHVGATVGGGVGKNEESINKVVASSGDSSTVQQQRHNISEHTTSTGTINYGPSGEQSSSSKTTHISGGGITQTIYSNQTHFRNASGVFLSSTGQMVSQGSGQWQGGSFEQGQGGQNQSFGKTKIHYSSSGKQTGEAESSLNKNTGFSINGGNYQHHKAGDKEYVYRCLKRINGREEEVDCGPNFSFPSVNNTWLLQQSGAQQTGNIQYRCFEEVNGQWKTVDCGKQFSNAGQNINTDGGSQINVNIIHKCKEEVNGEWHEIPCGPNGLPEFNSSRYHSQFGGDFKQVGSSGVNVIHECYQTTNGVQRKVDCNALPSWTQQAGASSQNYGGQQSVQNYGNQQQSGGSSQNQGGSFQGHGSHQQQFGGSYQSQGGQQQTGVTFQGHGNQQQSGGTLQSQGSQQQAGGSFQGRGSQQQSGGNVQSHGNQQQTGSSYQGHGNQQQTGSSYQGHGSQQQISNRFQSQGSQQQSGSAQQSNQYGETSFRQEHRDNGAQHAEYDEGKIKYERQRAEYERQKAEYERKRAEYEREQRIRQENQHSHHQQSNTQGGQYHQQSNSQGAQGSSSQTTGSQAQDRQYYQGSHQQQGSTSQGSQHHQGSQITSSQAGASHNQAAYDSGSYEYDDDEEQDGGKAISGYIDTTNAVSSSNQGVQGRRDPKTYGTYDESRSRDRAQQSGVGAAALGNGFSVTTLDLGDLGGRSGGQSGHAGETLVQGGQGSGTAQSGRGKQWREESHWSETRQIPPTYQNTVVERDNVPTDRPTNKKFYGRKKRQLDDHPSIREISNLIKCNSVQCIYMRCTINNLENNKQVSIALRARINARVLRNVSSSEPLSFSSVMAARINKLPYIGTPAEQILHTHEIFTTVSKNEAEIKPEVVPLWVVVLSAVAGTIILLLLVFLLYKLGFFKRNRPSSAPERQPLNKNGYHHGDEAL